MWPSGPARPAGEPTAHALLRFSLQCSLFCSWTYVKVSVSFAGWLCSPCFGIPGPSSSLCERLQWPLVAEDPVGEYSFGDILRGSPSLPP